MSRPLPVALAQVAALPVDAPVSAFADDVGALLRRFPQTRLVVHPELHLFGGADDAAALAEAAEPLAGPRLRALAELAGDLGVWLVPGSVAERGPAGQLFNTAPVFSPRGELVAAYRKIFPWRPYEPFDAGDAFVVVDLADGDRADGDRADGDRPGHGRVGLSICYDAWFPEVARQLAWLGAEVIVNVVMTTTSDRAQEVVLARATAITNQVFVVSVNAAGPAGTGRSLVADPEGLVRVETADASPTVLTDVLDLDHVTTVREFGTAGLNRMWSQFGPGDPPIDLPLYAGRIDPTTWSPSSSPRRSPA